MGAKVLLVVVLGLSRVISADFGNLCRCTCGSEALGILIPSTDACKECTAELCKTHFIDECSDAPQVLTHCVDRFSKKPKIVILSFFAIVGVLLCLSALLNRFPHLSEYLKLPSPYKDSEESPAVSAIAMSPSRYIAAPTDIHSPHADQLHTTPGYVASPHRRVSAGNSNTQHAAHRLVSASGATVASELCTQLHAVHSSNSDHSPVQTPRVYHDDAGRSRAVQERQRRSPQPLSTSDEDGDGGAAVDSARRALMSRAARGDAGLNSTSGFVVVLNTHKERSVKSSAGFQRVGGASGTSSPSHFFGDNNHYQLVAQSAQHSTGGTEGG